MSESHVSTLVSGVNSDGKNAHTNTNSQESIRNQNGTNTQNKQSLKKKSFAKKKKSNSNLSLGSQNNYQSSRRSNRGNNGRNNAYNSHGENYDNYDDLLQHEILASQLSSSSRSRKGQISINHLLDFSLPEREQVPSRGQHHRKQLRNSRGNYEKDTLHLTGKEYINANYRFIVDYRGHYEQQKLDPNIPINNHDILRVIIRNGNACPICLEEEDSVAPRMVSCGHCFCYTCLLNYLDSEDDRDKKEAAIKGPNYQKKKKECPLCAMKINQDEIFPVLLDSSSFDEKFETPKVNHDAIFKLMVKPHDSLISLPVSNNPDFTKLQKGEIPWCCDEYNNIDRKVYPYARVMKGNLDFILQRYQKEIDQINVSFKQDKVMFGSINEKYVQLAIKKIQAEMKRVKLGFGKAEDYEPQTTEFNEELVSKLTIKDDGVAAADDALDKYNIDNSYFYYQTNFNSSIKYLLSSLDVKILKAVFNDYSNFPSTIVLPVENIVFGEVLTMNNLSRYKYMSHFPFGTELAFLEINWLLGHKDNERFRLPDNIYNVFKREIQNRSRANKKKLQLEEKNRKIAMKNLEAKTKEFYERENDSFFYPASYNKDFDDYSGSFTTAEDEFVPLSQSFSEPFTGSSEIADVGLNDALTQEGESKGDNFTTTVWGTKIRKSQPADMHDDDQSDETGVDTEEILRRIQEQEEASKSNGNATGGGRTGGGKKKGKKRLVLITSNSRGA